MGDTTKRTQETQDQGHRKKHHPDDQWSHYEVSGQFNACIDDSDGKEDHNTKGNDQKDEKPCSNKSNDDEICLDGDLRGDAHVNSKGLIVGQAEVQSKNNSIDVNFEMQANEKRPRGPKKEATDDDPGNDGSGKNLQRGDQGSKVMVNNGKSEKNNFSGGNGKANGLEYSKKTPQDEENGIPHSDPSGQAGPAVHPDSSPSNESSGSSETASTAVTSTKSDDQSQAPSSRDLPDTQAPDSTQPGFLGGKNTNLTENMNMSDGTPNNNVSDDTNSVDSKDEGSSGDTKDETRSSTSSTEPYTVSSVQVNQAPFIQKLYAMLEDPKLEHVIRWAPSGNQFFINPNEQFSQTLCLYFKHTNISSFVRQLSMYGFHKVSNSGQQRDKWYPWEFRHMDGLFKRGDIDGIRSIKRRSTRQMNGKRVKYLSVVNGNDYVKQEQTPNGFASAPPHNPSTVQGMPHYLSEQPLGPGPTIPFAAHYQSPMVPPHMGYQDISNGGHNGNGSGAINGNGNGHVNSATGMRATNGNGTGHIGPINTSAPGPQPDDGTMALVKMHQSVQTQLAQVQETVSRLSQNVNEMGNAIGHLIAHQVPGHAANGTQINNSNHNNNSMIAPAGTSKHFVVQSSGPNAEQVGVPQSGRHNTQDDGQSRFELRTLLN